MPKNIIKEYDLTSINNVENNIFAVVVPGLVQPETVDNTIWDENGICEINPLDSNTWKGRTAGDASKTAQQWFKKYIGCVPYAAEPEAAVPAVADPLNGSPTEGYYTIPAGTKVYTRSAAATFTPGYLVDNSGYEYTYVFTSDGYGKFPAADEYYQLTNEGKNATTAYGSIGNQVAYELLGIGYPVLYKKITNIDTDYTWENFSCLVDRNNYVFRYIITGLKNDATNTSDTITVSSAEKLILKIASKYNTEVTENGRGDCIALVDVPTDAYKDISVPATVITKSKAYAKAFVTDDEDNIKTTESKYLGIFEPEFTFIPQDNDYPYTYTTLPAYVYYLASAKEAELNNYDEWFAIAGKTRGTNSFYKIKCFGYNFGESAADALQPRDTHECPSVNTIIRIKNSNYTYSYYIWGNRTAYCPKEATDLKASHFLNIRQLCCGIKNAIYDACCDLKFEPNNIILWNNFCNKIRPILEKAQTNQGIEDYRILKVATERKAEVKAIVRIVPVEAVEDFDISLTLEDGIRGTLVSFDEDDE